MACSLCDDAVDPGAHLGRQLQRLHTAGRASHAGLTTIKLKRPKLTKTEEERTIVTTSGTASAQTRPKLVSTAALHTDKTINVGVVPQQTETGAVATLSK